MKNLRRTGIAALAVTALAVSLGSASASATTLEVGGVTKNESLSITTSLKSGTSFVTKDTFGFVNNTCKKAHGSGTTSSPYSGTTVTGSISELTFSECNRTITYHNLGTLHIEHIPGTTNGTLRSSGAVWTSGSPFGVVRCETGENAHVGTLAGVSGGQAVVSAKVLLNCSGISTVSEYTAVVTSPEGLGVSA